MPHSFKLSRRIARLRASLFAVLALALAGCDATDSLSPESSTPALAPVDAPSLASVSFAGGIPMGAFAQPTATLGDRYNGGLRNIWPQYLLNELENIKARGGKVVLTFTGHEDYFKDADGDFSLSKWKERVDRFRKVNFSSYVTDGTIIGHFLIDEPNDASNWNGKPVPASTVEQMAQYSKQIWPNLTTVVRVDPNYLRYDHRYLDAAWAQYVNRKGSAADYIRRNVEDAQARGLALIVGLNLLKGGVNGSKMTATQVRDWGSTLLTSSYPCAFISWKYEDNYFSTSGMKDAMDVLRDKAENRSLKTCKG